MNKTIYNSDTYETYSDNDIIENLIENGLSKENITESMLWEERDFLSQMDYDDEISNLDKILDNDIICIANLGLWHGRCKGYKLMKNNLNEVLKAAQGDFYHVYYDGYNIKAKDSHHDGTNYYLFRKIKNNVNIDKLLDKIYAGTVTKNDINNYTSSLRKDLKPIYGW